MKNNTHQTKSGYLLRTGKLLLIAGLSLMITVTARGADDDAGPDPDLTPVPFDGGISLLAAAGVSYGIKKWHDARKQKEADTQE